jgi:hypothetical protein
MATKKRMQSGGITGAEQGKGSKVLRTLGKVIPAVGAAALAVKATANKVKRNIEKKKIVKAAKDANITKAKVGGATKMKKYAMGGSALRPATDKANRGMYKTGGMKKPLRKAQPGMSVKTTPSINAPSLSSMGIKNVYSGPMTERDSKELDKRYPSTTAGPSLATSSSPGFNKKTRSYVTPEAVESYDRNRTENYLRSPHPEVKAYNENSKTPGNEMPLFNRSMLEAEDGTYKKGGATKRVTNKIGRATKKLFKTGGMVNANAKITATKSATGKSGGTTKAISKTAVKSASPKGKVGGTSKAPKKASPVKLAKAKMGGAKGKC